MEQELCCDEKKKKNNYDNDASYLYTPINTLAE